MPEHTVVIVDDEEELRENLTDLLEFKGFDVRDYANGENMLGELEQFNADLFLLDYQLPGLDGLELLRILKEKVPTTPVVIVTASTQPNVIEEAREAGANRVVHKPYAQAEMMAVVQELLA